MHSENSPEEPGGKTESLADPPVPGPLESADTPRKQGPAEPSPNAEERSLQLSGGDRRFLVVAGGLVLILLAANIARETWRGEPRIEVRRLPARELEFRIDVNSASWVEWMQLPEIGESLARRIVADREERGPFLSVEDVDRVKGIGPATMQKIRPFLTLSERPGESAADRSPAH